MVEVTHGPGTVDQQLGSPGFTFEISWLWGVAFGLACIGILGRRRRARSAP